MLLALARPEIHDVFPKLWENGPVDVLKLSELDGEACAELIRDALGERVHPETVTRLVKLAGGNAFYLEEMIRAVAEGRVETVPGTIMAMAQSRIGDLPAASRRVLRAAAIFGRHFWRGGVFALMGRDAAAADTDALLGELEAQEFIAPASASAAQGDVEYTFRHELVREAAYSTLTARDRTLGHRLAADWLEGGGAADALTLATHFELGNDPARAAVWYSRSAEQALGGDDLGAALRRSARGGRLRCHRKHPRHPPRHRSAGPPLAR